MIDTRHELDERLLAEARTRATGRQNRRVLALLGFAVVIASIGMGKPDQAFGFVVAGLLVVLAVVIAIRGDR